MKFKLSTLARYTMPLLIASTLTACIESSNSTDKIPIEKDPIDQTSIDAIKAKENEAVIYAMLDTVNRLETTLHVWNNEACSALDGENIPGFEIWEQGVAATGEDENGVYWVLPLSKKTAQDCVNFIIRANGSQSADLTLSFASIADRQGFVSADLTTILDDPNDTITAKLEDLKGALINANTIAWEVGDAATYELHYLADGGFSIDNASGEIKSSTIAMTLTETSQLPANASKRYNNYRAFEFTIPDEITLPIDTLVSGQLVLVAKNTKGTILEVTGVQLAPALDAIYATGDTGAQTEQLGAIVNGDSTTFKLWAPTAKEVSLYLYDQNFVQVGQAISMTRKANGTWTTDDISNTLGLYYRYQVSVYHAALNSVETLQVTDPYSLSLSANSHYSQIVDLENQAKPSGWDAQSITSFAEPEQLLIYETHLRDLTSAVDDGGTDALDGKYLAITEQDRASYKQLVSLADNGMNVIHLMNMFDIATVNEDPAQQVQLDDTVTKLCEINDSATICIQGISSSTIRDVLAGYDPSTGDAQALLNDLRAYDSFNWGYDPFHYTTPEGSYATNANGITRVKEYRTLIMQLHEMGYRVVMDVVYNHTNSAGTNDKSVLDKIVPGYYQRLNAAGVIETSTCCSNTATEHIMMGKLMTDSLVTWATQYKIDGFRFDLMGHQPKQLMIDSLNAVQAVDQDNYFYGEGWNFGEVANDALFVQATQSNMAGTGIGTFSDRLRDAVRGGGPFDSGNDLRKNQGFTTAGLWNELQEDLTAASLKVRKDGDMIRLGMAGNLANFKLIDQTGSVKQGKEIDYNGQQAGYTLDPQENISYVSKHDNQTLWDNNMYKVASQVTSEQRAQMQILSLSINVLGQGIPFLHMGSELLRSKSMQRDSYDSGDWFNTVNFDMSNNNWNVGLPRQDKDGDNWPLIQTIIEDPQAQPTSADIKWTDTRFKELLKIRTSSPLFSLTTEEEIQARVDFQNTGSDSITGLIVMSIDDGTTTGIDLDPNIEAIVTIINATNEQQVFPISDANGFTLHPSLVDSSASFIEGTFTVPALSTAVFIKPQGESQGLGLSVKQK
ncbi:pullulanase-type alpha-1,6-glucosidase [uncultured Psychromonas sp.]|uniref:pullulanase-type alpha-1,6-glucosidase n=1 Tax=uncultured Psychromonas sp. TaxID=173974 RepID=UPI00262EFFBE|nr:pullulanase-type alpha-1,6-glucosidase [uncultured Psychromonas sp.]